MLLLYLLYHILFCMPFVLLLLIVFLQLCNCAHFNCIVCVNMLWQCCIVCSHANKAIWIELNWIELNWIELREGEGLKWYTHCDLQYICLLEFCISWSISCWGLWDEAGETRWRSPWTVLGIEHVFKHSFFGLVYPFWFSIPFEYRFHLKDCNFKLFSKVFFPVLYIVHVHYKLPWVGSCHQMWSLFSSKKVKGKACVCGNRQRVCLWRSSRDVKLKVKSPLNMTPTTTQASVWTLSLFLSLCVYVLYVCLCARISSHMPSEVYPLSPHLVLHSISASLTYSSLITCCLNTRTHTSTLSCSLSLSLTHRLSHIHTHSLSHTDSLTNTCSISCKR